MIASSLLAAMSSRALAKRACRSSFVMGLACSFMDLSAAIDGGRGRQSASTVCGAALHRQSGGPGSQRTAVEECTARDHEASRFGIEKCSGKSTGGDFNSRPCLQLLQDLRRKLGDVARAQRNDHIAFFRYGSRGAGSLGK